MALALQKAEQIPLDLPHRAATGREDFLVGQCNQDAVAWLDRWPEWPAPMLVIQGPPASGKSHLAAVWRERTNAEFCKPETLDASIINGHVVLDGLDLWLGDRETETRIFHLYNLFKEEGGSFLVTMRMSPSEITFAVPDLASRFRAAPLVSIHTPDDDLLSSILIKMFHDRQLAVNADIIQYILPRMERSFAGARDVVEHVDRKALAQKRAISIPLVRKVLSELQSD